MRLLFAMSVSLSLAVLSIALIAFAFVASLELLFFRSTIEKDRWAYRFLVWVAAVINAGLGIFSLHLFGVLGRNWAVTVQFELLNVLHTLAFSLGLGAVGIIAIRATKALQDWPRVLVVFLVPFGSLFLHLIGTKAIPLVVPLTHDYRAMTFSLAVSGVLTWWSVSLLEAPAQGQRSKLTGLLAAVGLALAMAVVQQMATFTSPLPQMPRLLKVAHPVSIHQLDILLGLIAIYLMLAMLCILFLTKKTSDKSLSQAKRLSEKNTEIQHQIKEISAQVDDHVRQMHERYLHAMDSVEEGLWDLDLATGSIYISKAWAESLGYSESSAYRSLEEWRALVHPDDIDPTRYLLNEHLEGRSPVYISEYRLKKGTGDWLWVSSRGKLLRDAYGIAIRVVGIHHDIQQRKLAEQALENAFETEKRLSTLKSEFVTMLSHELRTPLTVLVSSRALLGASLDSGVITRGSLNRYLGQMDQSIARLRTLVEETLTYVQIETTVTRQNVGAVDIAALVKRAADEIAKRNAIIADNNGASDFSVRIESELKNTSVRIDEVALFQVVKQLLEHSVHASATLRRFKVSLTDAPLHIVLSLMEDHLGLETEQRQRTFEEFCTQSDHVDLAIDKLGLAIVKRLVDRMGAEISASSSREGLKVVFNIPKG